MTEPKAKELKDRIIIKIRNPYDNKYIQKTFKYNDYDASASKAEEEAEKWKKETLALLIQKNQLEGKTEIIKTGPNPKKKLQNLVNSSSESQPIQGQTNSSIPSLNIKKKKFPFETWIPTKTGASLTIIARSKGGKTSLLKRVVSELPKDIIKIVITPNLQNNIYDSMKKKSIFSPIFDSRIIKLIQRINQKTKNHYRFVVILDDLIDLKHNSQVLKMFLTLRNANISAVISLQSPLLCNKMLRGNTNYLLLGKLTNEENIKDAYSKFLSNYSDQLGIRKSEDIYKIYNELTDDYNFIYVNNLKEKIYQTNKSL